MKKIIAFILILISFSINAQENTNETKKPIKTIYVMGGIASTYTQKDSVFEKKYHIHYHDFGCLAPSNFEEYETKNKTVFDELKKEFGLQWLEEIKTSAFGLDKWKKNS